MTNGHASVPCVSCHIGGNYTLQIVATDCGNSGCHLTTWQKTTNPVHSAAGTAFAVGNCAGCHNTISWTTAIFDHSTTGFLLTNGHANVPCASCHVNNNYTLTITPNDCGNSGCHLTR
ncbi:MAG TPA: cytochrome c3 family protein, partial [Candidatus Acidoferrales bacterium]|nr:cytochrome c3 family protein [Candidatus Acidoferrales bacterium]